MTDHLKTIREVLDTVHITPKGMSKALAALAELERTHYTAEDVADASAQGFRDGVASVTAGLEPVAWLVCSVNSDGSLSLEHAAAWEEAAHEHINDAITEHGIEDAASWVVRPAYVAAPVAQQARVCGLCGADKAFTGTCGGGRDNPKALCYETPAQPAQPAYWMVECKNGFTGWATKIGKFDCRFFDTDPLKAKRFATKSEAEAEIASKGNSCMVATEHQDIEAPAQQADIRRMVDRFLGWNLNRVLF